jgi:hypothetical protein
MASQPRRPSWSPPSRYPAMRAWPWLIGSLVASSRHVRSRPASSSRAWTEMPSVKELGDGLMALFWLSGCLWTCARAPRLLVRPASSCDPGRCYTSRDRLVPVSYLRCDLLWFVRGWSNARLNGEQGTDLIWESHINHKLPR